MTLSDGPWTWVQEQDLQLMDASGKPVIEKQQCESAAYLVVNPSDARAIAAVPELVEALRVMVRGELNEESDCPLIQAVRAGWGPEPEQVQLDAMQFKYWRKAADAARALLARIDGGG